MKPEEQRIAIAEACGLTGIPAHGQYGYRKREGMPDVAETIPDYLNDLDAMAEAEKVLNPQQAYEYGDALAQMIRDEEDKALNERVGRKWKFNGHGYFKIATLTATQRAPVFLKTIGKWTDQ